MNRSIGLAVAALLLTGILLWWWGTSELPQRTAVAASDADETDAPADEPQPDPRAAPLAQPAPVAQAEPAAPAAPEPAAPAPAAEPAAPAAEPEGHTAIPEGSTPPTEPIGPLAKLKGAYESDPVDPQARDVEHQLRALFGRPETPIEMLQDVRCRKRSCKIELRWVADKPFAYMGAGMLIATQVNPEIAVEPSGPANPNGPIRYDLYVSRDGYESEQYRTPVTPP